MLRGEYWKGPWCGHSAPLASPVLASQHQCSPLSTSARLSAPVLPSQHQCSPISTSAPLSAPVLTSRHQCSPLGTSAPLSAPVLTSQHQCSPLGTSAHLSAPVLPSRHQCSPLSTNNLAQNLQKPKCTNKKVADICLHALRYPCSTNVQPLSGQLTSLLKLQLY